MGFEKTGSTFLRGDEVCIFDFSNKFGEGWDWTWQVPRADFDNTLLRKSSIKELILNLKLKLSTFSSTEQIL
jgi:hypothetical protein